jgi:hypothetical protein
MLKNFLRSATVSELRRSNVDVAYVILTAKRGLRTEGSLTYV